MTSRKMVVTYAPGGSKEKPMIRISNNFLKTVGFEIGTAIEVTYEENIITINKVKETNYEHSNI